LGERIGELFSRAYLLCNKTGFKQYRAGALRGGAEKEDLLHFQRDELSALIERLKEETGPDDVILIKGRLSQRLGRVALALQGVPVKCTIGHCDIRSTQCSGCPMLKIGWEGRRFLL
jgi:UDP-N-acetylmuramyl pentapeptide synthase